MTEPRILLAGMGPKLSGLTWETNGLLRIGRQSNLDVVLRDHSVERVHAEIRHQGTRCIVRDVARNPYFPTFVNNSSVAGEERELERDDIVQIGKLQLRVAELVLVVESAVALPLFPAPASNGADRNQAIVTSGAHMLVTAKTQQTWDKALELVT